MEPSWENIRQQFAHIGQKVYLNHAAVSPLPRWVKQAIDAYFRLREVENIEFWPHFLEVGQRFRELVARLIGAKPEQIAYALNTSAGLNVLATGLKWTAGDRILLNNMEFPANVYPFLNLTRLGVEVDFVPHREGRLLVEDFARAITPRTRILSISFVQFLNGYRSPLKELAELCHRHGVIFCVDAIQGLGALQMNVEEMGIDFLAASGHKWLMWPFGTGFIYVSPRIFDQLHPAQLGWFSVQNFQNFLDYRLELLPHAGRFETGTPNIQGIIGAIASLEMMLALNPVRIQERVLHLSTYLYQQLAQRGYDLFTVPEEKYRSGIVTFRHEKAERLFQALQKQNIHVSLREGMIRVSPHFYNTAAEVNTFLEALEEFDRGSSP